MTSLSTQNQTAKDLMKRDVVVVRAGDSLREALDLMTENHVTGLPVMNSKEKCVGLISSSDILNYEVEHSEFAQEANQDVAQHFDMDSQRWESVRLTSFALEEFADVRVEEVMARQLISVDLETPIKDVARKMTDQGVHRVLVLDEEQRLYGIISATDFVELFAGA
ncbi:MAG: CBS domain-containing protein [Pirellulales bacterium]|nr:CBS domain-containing protein [Pirellulales bacterium]